MNQTHFPVYEAATNLQLFSLGNLLQHGSSVMPVSYQQRIPGLGPVNLFEGAMAIPKQRLQLLESKINGHAQFPPYVASKSSQMLSLGELVKISRATQVQQEDSHDHVWARQNPPYFPSEAIGGLARQQQSTPNQQRASVCREGFAWS
jgi:hypothetical protein